MTAAIAERDTATTTERPDIDHTLYVGVVRHERLQPRRHEFVYTVAQPLVRLDRIDELLGRSRLWSRRRFSPIRYRREDYLGDPSLPLDEAVRDLVEARGHDRPDGPIAMLAHLRTFGWCFNPIAVYYCYDAAGTTVTAQVLDVMNTPWGERHAYVITPDDAPCWGAVFDKELHVSPFMEMDQRYRLRSTTPDSSLELELANEQDGRIIFRAGLDLEREPATASGLRSILWRTPLMTLKVTAAIHWQALRLALKRIPFRPHPDKNTEERT